MNEIMFGTHLGLTLTCAIPMSCRAPKRPRHPPRVAPPPRTCRPSRSTMTKSPTVTRGDLLADSVPGPPREKMLVVITIAQAPWQRRSASQGSICPTTPPRLLTPLSPPPGRPSKGRIRTIQKRGEATARSSSSCRSRSRSLRRAPSPPSVLPRPSGGSVSVRRADGGR